MSTPTERSPQPVPPQSSVVSPVPLPALVAAVRAGQPPVHDTLVAVSEGVGPKQLPPFTVTGHTVYVTFACDGPGRFEVPGWFEFGPCSGTAQTSASTDRSGRQTISVQVDSTTRWRLLVQQSR